MGKRTVQIRVPSELADDIALVAAAAKQSVPEYAEMVLRAAVARDMPNAVKVVKERSEALKKGRAPEGGGEK
jgi:hypothetical protein